METVRGMTDIFDRRTQIRYWKFHRNHRTSLNHVIFFFLLKNLGNAETETKAEFQSFKEYQRILLIYSTSGNPPPFLTTPAFENSFIPKVSWMLFLIQNGWKVYLKQVPKYFLKFMSSGLGQKMRKWFFCNASISE